LAGVKVDVNNIKFSFATQTRLLEIRSLLQQCRLPTDGIEMILEHCIIAVDISKVIAVVALEVHGGSGLLRSLAVTSDYRGRSLGRTLCARIFNHARLAGLERLYLLTLDSENYFASLGFKRVLREEVPAEIQATGQFRSICPATAVCMTRRIGGETIHATAELLGLREDVPGARMWGVSLERTMLTYFEVDANSRFETHRHISEQITMVLSGELFFEVDGATHCIKPGEVIAIPSNVPHAVWTEKLPVTAIDAWSPVMKKYGSARN
jgi:amino-acid N-acetyltransferase